NTAEKLELSVGIPLCWLVASFSLQKALREKPRSNDAEFRRIPGISRLLYVFSIGETATQQRNWSYRSEFHSVGWWLRFRCRKLSERNHVPMTLNSDGFLGFLGCCMCFPLGRLQHSREIGVIGRNSTLLVGGFVF